MIPTNASTGSSQSPPTPPRADRPRDGLLGDRLLADRLLTDQGGAVYVEYIVLVLLVAVGFSAAVIALGVPLLQSFRMTQLFLGLPIP